MPRFRSRNQFGGWNTWNNNNFRSNWGIGSTEGRGDGGGGRKKKKSRKRQRTWEFTNEDVSWLGNLVGAQGRDIARHHVIPGLDDGDEDLPVVDLTQEESRIDCNLGTVNGDIVGLQYYKGTVNIGEMVNLEREPHNKYDRNAIRVINMDGQQVGHIKRELAKALAFVLDNKLARVEGIVPRGSNNTYTMPINITLWGQTTANNRSEAVSVLKYHGYSVTNAGLSSKVTIGSMPGTSTGGISVSDYSHIQTRRTFLSQTEVRNELDKLFDTLEEGDKTTMTEPAVAIKTPLYPHQKQALNWMICKENNEALPPFWEKRGNRYFNSLTVFTSNKQPRTVHGGILADDMGLGKTLEVISLILTNFCKGQPLAIPVPGRNRYSQKPQRRKLKAKKISKQPLSQKKGFEKKAAKNFGSDSEEEDLLRKQIRKMLASKAPGGCVSSDSDCDGKDTVMDPDIIFISDDSPECKPSQQMPFTLKPKPDLVLNKPVSVTSEPIVLFDDPVTEEIVFPEQVADIHPSVLCNPKPEPIKTETVPCKSKSVDMEPITIIDEPVSPEPIFIVKKSKPIKSKQKAVKQKAVSEPVESVRRSRRAVKQPARYVDDGDDDTEMEKPATKRSRKEDIQNVEDSVKDKSIKEPIIIDLSTPTPVKPLPESSQIASLPLKIPGFQPPQLAICWSDESRNKTPISSLTASTTHNATVRSNATQQSEPPVNKGKGKGKKKGKGKGKKLTNQVEDDAPPLPSLPAEFNDENNPPVKSQSIDGSNFISSDDSASSDEDWLPELGSQDLPYNCDKNGSDDDILPDLVSKELPFNIDKSVMSKCDSTTGRIKSCGPRTTLIVCPLSVMNNWVSQLEEHLRRDVHLEIYTFYGINRTTDNNLLESQDIVISTYGTVASDFKSTDSVLKKVHWLRIILDEGHYIRNAKTVMCQAILELKAERRWVLTGTPIQNSIKDLFSLVNFLKISPLTDPQWWIRTIERPIALGEETAIKRVQALMANIALRRTKNQQVNGKALVELPARDVFTEHVTLSEDERKLYSAMQTEGKLIISRYFQEGTLLHHYSQVLAILLRLRQLCIHPMLCSKAAHGVQRAMEMLGMTKNGPTVEVDDETKKKLIDALMDVLNSGSDEECPICLESLTSPVITPCAHVYCRACITNVINVGNPNAACPLCRGELKEDKLIEVPKEQDQIQDNLIITDENYQSSSKVDALLKSLVNLRSEDPTVKSIIVSQFTSLLNLIEIPLKLNGFKFARLDGTMTNKKRIENIDIFMDPSPGSPTIFLLSLKAGGIGLNLTAASRVFLMDPAWNPAAEEQCFDRCHRLGQKRDVIITKFIVQDSVEEKMLELQDRKRELMQGAFSKKQSANERRANRVQDIRNLLDM
ncbi:helicase-like transcription factor [Patella vulgata]|uniref:helicase-like transcription factor n=1 Tax=Patella vulgata TaxID=6465 RepID=UPI00217F587F|nr:helicase-like transcription factor [Patella vulgata]